MKKKIEVSGNQMSFMDFLGGIFTKRQPEDTNAQVQETPVEEVLLIEPEVAEISLKPKYDSEYVIPDGAENFRVEEDVQGSYLTKLKNNIEALKVLKTIKGLATKAQKHVLSLFVGFGGFSNVFKEDTEEAAELYELLEDDEYESLRKSTTTAFYTPKAVIDAMYEAVKTMGFKGGKILEPSCGSGKFIGCIPDDMDCEVTAVELDNVTSRVAQALYPRANVINKGFEEVKLPTNYFDLAISNVPFGDIKVFDEEYKEICKKGFSIHEYFLAKMIDKVHDNGIVAVLLSTYFMDSVNSVKRKYIADRAELLTAFRLPKDVFGETKVACDMLFFKKRETVIDSDEKWVRTSTVGKGVDEVEEFSFHDLYHFYNTTGLQFDFQRYGKFNINNYFIQNPEFVMGKIHFHTNTYGKYVPYYSGCFDPQLVLRSIPHDVFGEGSGAVDIMDKLPDGVIPNTFFISDGNVYFADGETVVEKPNRNKDMICSLIDLRETLNRLLDEQKAGNCQSRTRLNEEYDAFVESYGRINSPAVRKEFKEDYSYPILCGLEVLDKNNKFVSKAQIFEMQTTYVMPDKFERVEDANAALIKSLRFFAKVNIEYMCEITGMEKGELIAGLKGRIFLNPESKQYETSEEYLSGNVRKKLRVAEQNSLEDNVEALREALPQDVLPDDIDIALGAKWVPVDVYEDFAREVIADNHIHYLQIHYSPKTVSYKIDASQGFNERITLTWGVQGVDSSKDGLDLLLDCLENRDSKIYKSDERNGKTVRVIDAPATNEAQLKQNEMRNAFVEWLHKDEYRMNRLAAIYNETFNSYVIREYDGSFLDFPMKSPDIELRPQQVNGVARVLLHGNALLAHMVGAGKTYTIVASAMEGKRLGLFQKPLVVVPKGLLGQWQADWLELYPTARILCADEKSFSTDNRANFISKIALNDYDGILISYEQFSNITLSKELQAEYMEQEIAELRSYLNSLDFSSENRFTIKDIEKKVSNKEAALKRMTENINSKKEYMDFEMLGVDKIFVDEAHFYKNLFIETKLSRISGVQTTSAIKTDRFYQITRYMNETYNERGLVFATATPISNSMTEIYTMMRYLEPSVLSDYDVKHFDEWATTFGKIESQLELAPDGSTFRSVQKFSKFYNLPELITAFHQVADVKLEEDLDLNLPDVVQMTCENEMSEFQEEYMKHLVTRTEKIKAGGVDPSTDNMLLVTGDGKKLSIDPRILEPSIRVDDEKSKLGMVCANVYERYTESTPIRGTQMIFSDTSTPNPKKGWTLYQAIKDNLIAKGIPAEEIVFIHDADTKAKRKKLFKDMNAGVVRVLIGSTSKMGTGVNAQERMVAIHHVDVPWRPADIEQRNGRGKRRGNMNKVIYIYRYITKGSFDARAWQTVEEKQKYISMLMRGHKDIGRSLDGDIFDEATLSYGEIKACALKDPRIRDYFALENELNAMRIKVSGEKRQVMTLNRKLRELPAQISNASNQLEKLTYMEQEVKHLNEVYANADFTCTIGETVYDNRTDAAEALGRAMKKLSFGGSSEMLGTYRGMSIIGHYSGFINGYSLGLGLPILDKMFTLYAKDDIWSTNLSYHIFMKLDNILTEIPYRWQDTQDRITSLEENLCSVQRELEKHKDSNIEKEYKEKKLLYDRLGEELNFDVVINETAAIA